MHQIKGKREREETEVMSEEKSRERYISFFFLSFSASIILMIIVDERPKTVCDTHSQQFNTFILI
jgi:hypothetical protein